MLAMSECRLVIIVETGGKRVALSGRTARIVQVILERAGWVNTVETGRLEFDLGCGDTVKPSFHEFWHREN